MCSSCCRQGRSLFFPDYPRVGDDHRLAEVVQIGVNAQLVSLPGDRARAIREVGIRTV